MKISIGCDHAAFEYKQKLIIFLKELGHEVIDFGTDSEKSCDYPDIAHPLARSIEQKEALFGIALCGSGNGINMTLNKHQGIRSALCWNTEIAELARLHNNANVIALPARFIDFETAKNCVKVFINTQFEGGRHLIRVNKIAL